MEPIGVNTLECAVCVCVCVRVRVCVCVCVCLSWACLMISMQFVFACVCMLNMCMDAKCPCFFFPVCLTVRQGCPGSSCRSIPQAWACTRPPVCTAAMRRGCLRVSIAGRGSARDKGTVALEGRSNTDPNVLESASPGAPKPRRCSGEEADSSSGGTQTSHSGYCVVGVGLSDLIPWYTLWCLFKVLM